jgi:hypothetical protein
LHERSSLCLNHTCGGTNGDGVGRRSVSLGLFGLRAGEPGRGRRCQGALACKTSSGPLKRWVSAFLIVSTSSWGRRSSRRLLLPTPSRPGTSRGASAAGGSASRGCRGRPSRPNSCLSSSRVRVARYRSFYLPAAPEPKTERLVRPFLFLRYSPECVEG